MKKIFLTAVVLSITFAACKTTKVATTATPTPPLDCTAQVLTYSVDIKPIMEQHCVKCHNTNEKAGYNFLTLEAVKKGAANGELLNTIKHANGFPNMPAFADKLDQPTIDKIECWINNGMKE